MIHFLTELPNALETQVHDKCMTVLCLALPAHDLIYVKGATTIRDVWVQLKAKYMPSKRAAIRTLYQRFNNAQCKNGRVVEYVRNVKTIVNELTALNARPSTDQIVTKLLELGSDPHYTPLRLQFQDYSPEQEERVVEEIIAKLHEQAQYLGSVEGQGYGADPRNR